MPIKVIHKTERRSANLAPCCVDDFYSIDGGKTWLNRKEFHQWHNSLIEVKRSWQS